MKELLSLFLTFAKIGAFMFGGGYAMLPLLEIGVLRVENGCFLTQTVQEKKQIQKALLYPVLCLE